MKAKADKNKKQKKSKIKNFFLNKGLVFGTLVIISTIIGIVANSKAIFPTYNPDDKETTANINNNVSNIYGDNSTIIYGDNYNTMNDYIIMPYVVGLDVEKAKEILLKIGLKIDTEFSYSKKEKNIIINQSINEGVHVSEGTIIEITVSKGQKPMIMPDLYNLNEEEASKQLLKNNISKDIVAFVYGYSEVEKGCIYKQNMKEGTIVKEQDIIKIYVSKGSKPESAKSKTQPSKPNTSTNKSDNKDYIDDGENDVIN